MDWEIQALSKSCVKCQKIFGDKDDFHSFLVLSPEGLPARSDFCIFCFDTTKETWTDPYSYWQGQTKIIQKPPRVQPLPYEKFELLLRKYIHSQDSRDKKFSYILSLLLERKRILIPRESKASEEHKKFLVYEHRDTSESFILEDPHLSLDQIEEVEKELKDVMEQEFQFEPEGSSATTSLDK